jgi:uracil-DNA glycosylase
MISILFLKKNLSLKIMRVKIEESWRSQLQHEFEKDYFQQLADYVKGAYQRKTVYPPGSMIFRAFDLCPFDQVQVVIIGQDPYHGPGQAHGLCFSVSDGVTVPPSLKNIFKEIKDDLHLNVRPSGNLERWARQGILLLNATLTVEAKRPGSHQEKGWEIFTDQVIKILSENKEHLVFMLWGAYAQKKGAWLDSRRHLILKAAHPSPFAAHRGFMGCKHFSKANQYLIDNGRKSIDWR